MDTRRQAILASTAVLLLAAAGCGSNSAPGADGDSAARVVIDRDARGNIAENGGARRLTDDQSRAIADSIQRSGAKNVILIIGDGASDQEYTLARNYQWGAAGKIPGIDELPLNGAYTTYSLDKDTGKPNYTTDSAAAGTAFATGTKTYNGGISVDLEGRPQRAIIEIAKANGLATGNVTTAALQDATPAVQVAHVVDRKCDGPAETAKRCPANALENGGSGSITEQLLAARPDVTLGGGGKVFGETATAGEYRDKTLEVQAKERGYRVVRTAEELRAVEKADQQAPLLGLFADGTMPRLWSKTAGTRDGGTSPAVRCTPNPDFTTQTPRLGDMTRKAIDLLSGRGRDGKGFFLQVESASIDKAAHEADPCGQIGETVQLSDATSVALDYAKKHKDTLVIVTGDHAHSTQIIESGSDTPGLTRTLMTADGVPMTVNYATSLESDGQQHSGVQVRIAAYGPGAANVVGVTDQTDTFFVIVDQLGLDRDKK
ncbi:alkaline phosphatase [Gordonia araii NBRC 100433]|uniref:Alkaline phosphatase n=1 Tax=Gordonia araii NBRC 100433 TaxID=1073574 RepID=G7GX82_9ACTN|nr:alkaline phosphatase [Gordonia araii]NNG98980.1 alkaline phosphatase [Gordonia araii NBRC 100433]GAB08207.1 alkaline phosphatase [Gordonia araii NBRC 100433]